MSLWRYLVRSLWHYRAQGLLVALGVAVATAAITGALVTGDSVRLSVRGNALARLGTTTHALAAPNLFTESLAARLKAHAPGTRTISPLLTLRGAARNDRSGVVLPGVSVYGVDSSFSALYPQEPPPQPADRDCAVSASTANSLRLLPGDDLILTIPRFQSVPSDTLFARRERENSTVSLRISLKRILPDRGSGGLALDAGTGARYNIFLNRNWLGAQLQREGQAGLLLVNAGSETGSSLRAALASAAILEDYGLKIVPNPRQGYLSLESGALLLSEAQISAARAAIPEVNGEARLTSVFLASALHTVPSPGRKARSIAYAVAAADAPLLETPSRSPDQAAILLNQWAAEDLGAQRGDRVELDCLVPQRDGGYGKKTFALTMQGMRKMEGIGADRGLTPDFEGITDAKRIGDWNPPFPMDLSRVTRRDEQYWERWHAAPKAFVSIETAQRFWAAGSSGKSADWVTSLRIFPEQGTNLSDFEPKIRAALLRHLQPENSGLSFQPVRALALRASEGSTDFSGLFLGMGLFVILSAAGLAGMMMRFSVERRAGEIGLLLAQGLPLSAVRCLLVTQGAIPALLGALAGSPLGLLYSGLIVRALAHWFGDASGDSPLHLAAVSGSLIAGSLAGFLVGLSAVIGGVRSILRVPALSLLAGGQAQFTRPASGRPRLIQGALILLLLLALLLAASGARGRNGPSPLAFFGVGACLLASGLAACHLGLIHALQSTGSAPSPARLALRNAAVHRGHSVPAAGLVASASFVLVTVAANTRGFSAADTARRDSGAGGYTLTARLSTPFAADFGSPAGRARLGFAPQDESLWQGVQVAPLLLSPGDDTSCLNLARPMAPRLLGASQAMIEQGGFAILPRRSGEQNPWTRLLEPEVKQTIPAFGDSESVEWNLHSRPGLTFALGENTPTQARFVGLISSSIFAGELIVSEENFLKLHPDNRLPTYFLIRTPPGREAAVADSLRRTLGEAGLEVRSTRQILTAVAGVQNAYLSSFLALGGLGALLGTLGQATVLLRSARERRKEFALLLAIGFERTDIARLLALETAVLLLAGVAWGTLSALIATIPQWLSTETRINVPALAGMLTALVLTGMFSCLLAARSAAGSRLIEALRSE